MFYFFPVGVAHAEAAAASAGPSAIVSLLPLILLFVIFYFLLIRPQQKKVKEHKNMLGMIQKGDTTVTTGGIHGRITSVGEETVTMEVADNVRIKVSKEAVAQRKPQDG